jgi:glycosyltransferase involved in cell wall biosynthesis
LRAFYQNYAGFPLVSISDSQRKPLAHLRWIRTIHHGYPKSQYAFSCAPRQGYLAFLGRIAPEKGVDRAIDIAQRAGLPLRIAAKIDFADRGYFTNCIAPLLENAQDVQYIGEISEQDKSDFLGNAAALLFPIDWPEPFGLVMIEAMACGTPVIAFNRGSVPEVIEHGLTGFIVETVEEAAEAARRAIGLDRVAIRLAFEERFTAETMAVGYEAAYRSVLGMADGLASTMPATRQGALNGSDLPNSGEVPISYPIAAGPAA